MHDFSLSVHGHFYQPAREDPISGIIPFEIGAVPYNNWNELIFHHCYQPNAQLRNFERISFNIGPTLFSWMEKFYPETVSEIIYQERTNFTRNGVGNGLAQPYHHTILPLATREDKITQIAWGIEDFKIHFGHLPAGMWLPETAVDLETLNILVDHGIEFTILAPWQADSVNLDSSQPYWVELDGDKKIAVFFYDQEISTKISFDPISTSNADVFASGSVRPLLMKNGEESHPKLILAATDGELYGHHQQFRDKFLDHLLNGSLSRQNIEYTYPALWLKHHPPTKSVKIKQFTSWSCHHGIDRWSHGCDCTPTSSWKNNLRTAIDAVAKIFDHQFEQIMHRNNTDPQTIRNAYGLVITHQLTEKQFIDQFFEKNTDGAELEKIGFFLRGLVERQKMYTSCGWFFEDFDRIEPKNVVSYAALTLFWCEAASSLKFKESVIPLFAEIHSQRNHVSGDAIFNMNYLRAQRELATS